MLSLPACETADQLAETDTTMSPAAARPTPESQTSQQSAETVQPAASDGDGAAVFAAILGGVAAAGLIAAGASGDAGQQAIAAAAASADDQAAADLLNTIQAGTAPAAAANEARLQQQANVTPTTGGSSSCDEALRRVDQQLNDATPRITNNIERMEATMWALMGQIDILRNQCPQSEPYTSVKQQHEASLDATIKACNGVTTKAACVAQLPTGQPSAASRAFVAEQQAETGEISGGDAGGKKPRRRCGNGQGVCTAR